MNKPKLETLDQVAEILSNVETKSGTICGTNDFVIEDENNESQPVFELTKELIGLLETSDKFTIIKDNMQTIVTLK